MIESDTLGSLGESAVLARIFPLLPASRQQLIGPGDDAALMTAPDGRFVVTTDMMIHGPDFRLAWSSPHDLGWKAAASNLADVAAMGARPTALVVAIAAPADSPISLLEGIATGLHDGCLAMAPGCGVVGGDLSVSSTLTLAVTAFGDLGGRDPVLRSGASVGDLVAVSGPLGEAASALRLLFEQALDAEGQPDAALAAGLRDRTAAQLAPTPPIGDGLLAARSGATAMLDLSDGLAIDSARLAKASGVGLHFNSSSFGDDGELALHGGEDHSLLATFPADSQLPGGFRRIGSVIAGEGIFVDGDPVDTKGWDPYRDWAGGRG